MLHFQYIFYINGLTLAAFSGSLLLPFIAECFFYEPTDHQGFIISAFICGSLGLLMSLASKPKEKITLKIKDTFFLTTLNWFTLSLASSLPFYLSSYNLSFIDSFFEAVSGLTTTGGTVLSGLDFAPRSIILWRAILQWLGGTGIILMALSVLPMLRIGGMQLFHTESSDRSEKILPRVSQIASGILIVYTAFTIICLAGFYFSGMTFFDALCQAMTTISTGGFCSFDQSFRAFASPNIEFIAIVFMIIGSAPLVLFVKVLHKPNKLFLNSSQMRLFLGLVLSFVIMISLWNRYHTYPTFSESLRLSSFTVVSMITTTGFSNANYDYWGAFPLISLYLISLIGGCTGSTAGGLKVFRLQIMWQVAIAHLKQLIRPHGVFIPIFDGNKIENSVVTSIFSFLILFFLSLFIITIALSICGNDPITSFCAATATLNNGAASFGEYIGANGSYETFNYGSKIILILSMLLGRLELLTILVLFVPTFWKR